MYMAIVCLKKGSDGKSFVVCSANILCRTKSLDIQRLVCTAGGAIKNNIQGSLIHMQTHTSQAIKYILKRNVGFCVPPCEFGKHFGWRIATIKEHWILVADFAAGFLLLLLLPCVRRGCLICLDVYVHSTKIFSTLIVLNSVRNLLETFRQENYIFNRKLRYTRIDKLTRLSGGATSHCLRAMCVCVFIVIYFLWCSYRVLGQNTHTCTSTSFD